MVKKSIQYYFLNKKKQSRSKKAEYVDLSNVKRAAILFDYTVSQEKKIREFIGILGESNIDSKAISYLQEDLDNILREDMICFRDNDFNLMGVVKDGGINDFLSAEYDILFDLRDSENVVSNYVHGLIKRKFTVCYNGSLEDNDMIIEAKNDITFFSQNILEYLRKLKKA